MERQKSLEEIRVLNEDVYLILKYKEGSEAHINKLITKYKPFFQAESHKYLRAWNAAGIFDYDFDDAYQLILIEFVKTVNGFQLEKLVNDDAIKCFRIIGLFHNRIAANVKGQILSQNLNAKKRIPCYAKSSIDKIIDNSEGESVVTHWESEAQKYRSGVHHEDQVIQNQEFQDFLGKLSDRQKTIVDGLMSRMTVEELGRKLDTSSYYVNKEIQAISRVFKYRESVMF